MNVLRAFTNGADREGTKTACERVGVKLEDYHSWFQQPGFIQWLSRECTGFCESVVGLMHLRIFKNSLRSLPDRKLFLERFDAEYRKQKQPTVAFAIPIDVSHAEDQLKSIMREAGTDIIDAEVEIIEGPVKPLAGLGSAEGPKKRKPRGKDIRPRKPRGKMALSDEERKRRADRMKAWHAERRAEKAGVPA